MYRCIPKGFKLPICWDFRLQVGKFCLETKQICHVMMQKKKTPLFLFKRLQATYVCEIHPDVRKSFDKIKECSFALQMNNVEMRFYII